MAFRYQSGMEVMLLAGDGFFLNLNWVLLSLCQPFMVSGGEKSLSRLISVEPSYCSPWTQQQCSTGDNLGPLVDFSKETKLVSHEDDQATSSPSDAADMPNFQFVTHCFFLTHKSLILGTALALATVPFISLYSLSLYCRNDSGCLQVGRSSPNIHEGVFLFFVVLEFISLQAVAVLWLGSRCCQANRHKPKTSNCSAVFTFAITGTWTSGKLVLFLCSL